MGLGFVLVFRRHMTKIKTPWWVTYARPIDKVVAVIGLISVLIGLVVLVALVARVSVQGISRLDFDFLTSFPSRNADRAGIYSAWVGSIWVIVTSAVLTVPIGVMSGIYLEEYARKGWVTKLLEINISNLAGVPSIIYGLLGLGLFVRFFGWDRSVLAGASTLALLVLPIVILATREALRAVPPSVRESSYALGATKWQTTWHQTLPAAAPGVFTGIILALSRAIGETAPLIMIGALTYVAFLPEGIFDPFTVLPIQIFNWVSRPQQDFLLNAAAGVVVLLILTLLLNGLAIWLRQKYQQRIRW